MEQERKQKKQIGINLLLLGLFFCALGLLLIQQQKYQFDGIQTGTIVEKKYSPAERKTRLVIDIKGGKYQVNIPQTTKDPTLPFSINDTARFKYAGGFIVNLVEMVQ